MRRYTVRARRSGHWWALDVVGVRGAHTQVRRIDQAEDMAREAIAGVLDIPPASFTIVVAPEVPAAVRTMVDEATNARSQAAQAQVAAAHLTRDAARRLVQEGLTVRDAGSLLGVSHQRIAQLVRRIDLEDKDASRRASDGR